MRQQLTNEAHPSPAPGPQLPAPAKVMVRVPNWLGDAVMALPALGQLRRIFGAARITLVARPSVAELFDGEGLSDDLIVVSNSQGPVEKTRRLFDEARRLRRARFDMAVLLTNSFASALTARAGGAKQVVGYARDARRLL